MEGEISLENGRCYLSDYFFEKKLADRYFENLYHRVQWKQPDLRRFGRSVQSPRLVAWYGDKNAIYRYSGLTHLPLPWFRELREIRERVENHTRSGFNSVLINLYRDGNDSMGYHADDEPELGQDPVIASVSLGATRRFLLKHKFKKNIESIKIDLSHGSLLVMKGRMQRYWLHGVPKTGRKVSARINLTFRWVEGGYYGNSSMG